MNFNLGGRNRRIRLAVYAVAGALLLVMIAIFWPRGQKESLVIVDGQQYQLASFAATKAQITDQDQIESYLLTITYDDPARGTTRATINVPRAGLVYDRTLPILTVVWDPPTTLEGKTYSGARWNPGYKVPARDRPALVPEKPLTHQAG